MDLLNRTRTFSSSSALPRVYTETVNSVLHTYPGVAGRSGSDDLMQDIVTTKFRTRSKDGGIVNNPMYRETTSYTNAMSGTTFKPSSTSKDVYTQDRGWGNTLCGDLSPAAATSRFVSGQPLYINTDGLISLAETKALANVSAPDVESLVELAEFKETLATLRNPLKGLDEYLRRKWRQKVKREERRVRYLVAKSRNRRSRFGREIPKPQLPKAGKEYTELGQMLAGEWLKLRYGILPFIRSASAIVEALQKPYSARKTARATEKAVANHQEILTYTVGAHVMKLQVTYTREVEVRAGLLYDNVLTFNSQWGLNLHDIPSAIYEVVPFSFVVDWLLNLGDYIRALTPKVGVTTLASWVVVKDTTTITRQVISHTMTLPWIATAPAGGVDTMIYKTYRRTARALHPSIAVQEGSIEAILAFNRRSLDAISLLIQKLKK